ncbi:DUF1176 domain-containing protein [Tatumella ptyseos]|uniref:DUF1176 domain-containing protein n=1 Tax=Tatumella ptyseos TaxID=82987 RepID=UPI0023F09EB7|nr:DUF1176 domain-containing protein [Tatumella ptyseos]
MQLYKILLLSLLFPAGASHAVQPVQTIISGWELTCDNFAVCQGRNLNNDGGLMISFYRTSSRVPVSWLHVELHPHSALSATDTPLIQRLKIDNQPLAPVPSQESRQALLIDDPEAAQQTLTALIHGNRLTAGQPDGSGISLTALAAVIAEADKIQSAVPPTPALPETPPTLTVEGSQPAPVMPLTASESRDFADYAISQIDVDSCPLAPVFRQIKLAALSNTQALMLISCESAAYNTFYQAYKISRQAPLIARRLGFRLPFNYPQGFDLTNVRYDPQNRELTTLLWGRALGDCGTASHWHYDGQKFVLEKFSSESGCDHWHTASDWPVLWSSLSADRTLPADAGT